MPRSSIPRPLTPRPAPTVAKVPVSIASDVRLSRRNAICLRVLVALYGRHPNLDRAYVAPDVPALVRATGYQRTHVYPAIQELGRWGYLDIQKRGKRLYMRAILTPEDGAA